MQTKGLVPAMLHHKCPRCRQGNMYKTSGLNIKYAAMHEKCEHCNFKFEVEPGFFYGAMFVSYVFSVAIIISVFTAIYILFSNPELWVYLVGICSAIVLTMPLSFRYSRTCMLYFFGGVSYNEEYNRAS